MRTSTARILVFSAVCLVACCSCDPLYKKLAERHIDAGYGQYAMSNYTAAADEFSAAIWDTPTNADAYVGRAACKYALSNFVGAMGDYNTAIKLKPEATGSFLARGATKFRLHQ